MRNSVILSPTSGRYVPRLCENSHIDNFAAVTDPQTLDNHL